MITRRMALVVAVGVLAVSAALAGLPRSGQLQQVTTRRMGGKTQTIIQDIKWSGSKFRMEGSFGGRKTIIIGDGKTAYFYDPAAKQATAGKQSQLMGPGGTIMNGAIASAKAGIKRGKKIGSQRVNGFNCDVYIATMPMGNGKIVKKSWINKDPNLPIEVKSTVTANGNTVDSIVRNVKLGVKLPNSLFALPKGTKIIEHPQMPMMGPHGRPGMPKGHPPIGGMMPKGHPPVGKR